MITKTDFKKITLFIAGSTHSAWVTKVKRAITLLQIEMQKELDDSFGMSLICMDCDNPAADNNQDIYNHQIKEESDVFILLIDKVPVGPYSMEELIRACIYKEQQKHPLVYVFFTENLKDDQYVAELRNVVKTMTGRYSDFIDDPENIKKKIASVVRNVAQDKVRKETAIQKVVAEEQTKKQQAEINAQKQQKRKRIIKWSIAAFAALFVVISNLCSFFIANNKHTVPVLFAGGGSVRSYLDSCKVNLANRSDGIYIHVPTGDSWVMLGEEQKIDEDTRERERKYYPLILAADDINDNFDALKIHNKKEFFKNVGHIADIVIGEDPLYVSVPNNPKKLAPLRPFLHHLDQDAITASELADILLHFAGTDSLIVYHTARTSGTVANYQKAMTTSSDKVDENTQWCWMLEKNIGHSEYNSQNTLLSEVVTTPFVVLESKYYHIQGSFQSNDTRQLRFLDKNNNHVKKLLHLYFILRRQNHDKDNFMIDQPIYNFLVETFDKLNLGFNIKKEYNNLSKSDIVIQLNKLEENGK